MVNRAVDPPKVTAFTTVPTPITMNWAIYLNILAGMIPLATSISHEYNAAPIYRIDAAVPLSSFAATTPAAHTVQSVVAFTILVGSTLVLTYFSFFQIFYLH